MSKLFVSNLPVVTIAVNAASLKALIAAADQGRNQTVQNLSGSRSGVQYRVPGTSRMYTASAPGEYPAVATGNLREHIDRKVVKDEVQVGTAVEYGLYLEKKAPEKGGREWLRPSLEQAKPKMLAELSKRWF